jgi:hypothetical protein
MELHFLLPALSLRLPMGYQSLSLRQPDSPDFSSVIFPRKFIAVTIHYLIHSHKRHRRKRSC